MSAIYTEFSYDHVYGESLGFERSDRGRRNDAFITQFIQALRTGREDLLDLYVGAGCLSQELFLSERGLLLKRDRSGKIRVVVPERIRALELKRAFDIAVEGLSEAMRDTLLKTMWWPRLEEDIEAFLRDHGLFEKTTGVYDTLPICAHEHFCRDGLGYREACPDCVTTPALNEAKERYLYASAMRVTPAASPRRCD